MLPAACSMRDEANAMPSINCFSRIHTFNGAFIYGKINSYLPYAFLTA